MFRETMSLTVYREKKTRSGFMNSLHAKKWRRKVKEASLTV